MSRKFWKNVDKILLGSITVLVLLAMIEFAYVFCKGNQFQPALGKEITIKINRI